MDRVSFAALAEALERERTRLSAEPPSPARRREQLSLAFEEIQGSAHLAGADFTLLETRLLVERSLVPGGRLLAECLLVADYGEAARFVREAPPARHGRYLRVEEIVEIHARVARRSPEARPGAWRDVTVRAFAGGMVAPPPWLIPRSIAAFVDRFGAGPPAAAPPVAWVAEAHERFERIHPFSAGNGRAGRLLANLLLHRLELPSLIVRPREGGRYLAALRAADSRDPWPLAAFFARGVLRALARLHAADAENELAPLASFASGRALAAMYKAAQRGRLHAVRRGGRLCTTRASIEEYRALRAPPSRLHES